MNKGQIQVPRRTQRDYTLAFKLQIVDEVEKGDFTYKESPCYSYVFDYGCKWKAGLCLALGEK